MKLKFDNWWKDFESIHKNDKDGGLEALKELKGILGGFTPDNRNHFIDELLSREKYIIFSCELIELYGSCDQKGLIRERLKNWLDSESENYIGGAYVRTVLRTYQASDLELIRLYFKKCRGYKVPFELFDIDKSLFLESFELLLKEFDDESIFHYDGLLYLTMRIDILEFLIDNLSPLQSKRIQTFCRSKLTHSTINNDKWRDELLSLSNKKR
jgi:hypothetical protein